VGGPLMPPDVSVIIPTRDRWQLLLRSAGCALGQAGVALEVVIVDDGSITECPDLKVLRDRRVRMVRHTTSRGVSAARNTGMEVARGRWLAWLDDDDLWAPDKLAVQLGRIGTAVIVYGAAVAVDSTFRVTERWPAPSTKGSCPHSSVATSSRPGVRTLWRVQLR